MAAFRLCFGRRVNDFAHKTCRRSVLGSQKKRRKGATEASCLPAGFLLGNVRQCGAEDAADPLTVELRPRGSAAGPSLCDEQSRSPFKTYCSRAQLVGGQWCVPASVLQGTSSSPSLFRIRAWVYHSIRCYSGNGTRAEPLHKTQTGYYDVLEVPPTATQAQIKSAYYKQSFIYHPDRNSGSEGATTRFSEISEAYTVLGNNALRKKYDRGLLSLSDLIAAARPSGKDSAGSLVKQQPGSSRSVAGQHVQGGGFDFDAFYKFHYNEQLQRERDIRARKEEMLKKEKEPKEMSRVHEMAVGLLLVTGLVLLTSLRG